MQQNKKYCETTRILKKYRDTNVWSYLPVLILNTLKEGYNNYHLKHRYNDMMFLKIALPTKDSGKHTKRSITALPISSEMMTVAVRPARQSCCWLSSSPLCMCASEKET